MTHIAIDSGSLCIDGQIVGPMPAPDFYSPEQRKQLTREVARAVNAHDELVAALERIAFHESRSDRRHKGMVDVSEIADLQRIARAALAKARS